MDTNVKEPECSDSIQETSALHNINGNKLGHWTETRPMQWEDSHKILRMFGSHKTQKE